MDEKEAALFLAALGALETGEAAQTADSGLIESAEPMTASVEVEYSNE